MPPIYVFGIIFAIQPPNQMKSQTVTKAYQVSHA